MTRLIFAKKMASIDRRNDEYTLEGADPVGADKFIKFRIRGALGKMNAIEKGVGDEFTPAEFDVVAKNDNYKIKVNLDKKGSR